MTVNILAFGPAKEILGASSIELDLPGDASLKELRSVLENNYPALGRLASYRMALNNEFATDLDAIQQGDEIAIIPPVSGG
jgi:molybdopterin converting factor subunit 1